MRYLAPVLAVCLVLNSSSIALAQARRGKASERTKVEAQIRKLDEAWVKAAATKNPDAWCAFYAPNAVILPANEPMATTPAAIRKSIAAFLSMPDLRVSWKPIKIEVARSLDLAYLYGVYELTAKDGNGQAVTDRGKNVEIWKKQPNGQWKCVVDTWCSDLPVAATP